MQKEMPYKFHFTSNFKYHKASPEFSICTESILSNSEPSAHSLPTSATKTVILYPKLQAQKCFYPMLELELPRGFKIFERKDPHDYKK